MADCRGPGRFVVELVRLLSHRLLCLAGDWCCRRRHTQRFGTRRFIGSGHRSCGSCTHALYRCGGRFRGHSSARRGRFGLTNVFGMVCVGFEPLNFQRFCCRVAGRLITILGPGWIVLILMYAFIGVRNAFQIPALIGGAPSPTPNHGTFMFSFMARITQSVLGAQFH